MGEGSLSWTTTESSEKNLETVDHMASGWTDEKHSSFLNSIESSFVSQLYNNQSPSKHSFGWLSKGTKRTRIPGLYKNDLTAGQFKVLHRGCWENRRFNNAKIKADARNDLLPLLLNPWIQHFRSSSTRKVTGCKVCNTVGDNDSITPSFQLSGERSAGESRNAKKLNFVCPKCLQDSFGSKEEVSDQNFIDDDHEAEEETGRSYRKGRLNAESNTASVNDHLVPSENTVVTPSSNNNNELREHKNTVCSKKKSEFFLATLGASSETSAFKDQG